MTAHRIHGKVAFSCDGCPESLETENVNFDVALSSLDNAEWTMMQVGRSWQHLCPECSRANDRAPAAPKKPPPDFMSSSRRAKLLGSQIRKPPSRP